VIGVALLAWAVVKARALARAGGAVEISDVRRILSFLVPSLTGVVGFWATVAIEHSDFTRYARSQRSQVLGQALGLPATMTFYSFIGVAVTSATAIIFRQANLDPVQYSRARNPIAVVIAMLALVAGHAERERRRKIWFRRRTTSRISRRG